MTRRNDDSLDLLVQKLRWLTLPGMSELVPEPCDLADKRNLTVLDTLQVRRRRGTRQPHQTRR